MTTPPTRAERVTRAEFEALLERYGRHNMNPGERGSWTSRNAEMLHGILTSLAKRVAALEGLPDHGHAEPAPAMPKCPDCGETMVEPTDRQLCDWHCLHTGGCKRKVAAVCTISCGEAYCAAHLPKPDAPRCPDCNSDQVDERGNCYSRLAHANDGATGEPKPAPPPATAGVTTALDALSKDVFVPLLVRGAAVKDQRAAVAAAEKPLRERVAELERERDAHAQSLEMLRKAAGASSLMYLDVEVAKLAKAAAELARIRELNDMRRFGACSSEDMTELARLLTKAGG